MRYLIRLAKTKFDDWTNGQGLKDPQSLTDSFFRLTKARRNEFQGLFEDSTYLVNGELEEARTAAAHLLADPKPAIEARYLVRILLSDAKAVGLQLDDSAIGKTGVPWIDFRHRDLVGTKNQFRTLVEHLLEGIKEGHDKVRRIGVTQHTFSFGVLSSVPATEIPTCTRDVINCILTDTALSSLSPNIAQARGEIANIVLPHETVSLRAHCLVETGKGEATDNATWNVALNQLREEYRRNYPHAAIGP